LPCLLSRVRLKIIPPESGPDPGVLESILEIARARAQLLEDLKAALLMADKAKAERLARALCGLEDCDASGSRSRKVKH
jgi:hypothetical protein